MSGASECDLTIRRPIVTRFAAGLLDGIATARNDFLDNRSDGSLTQRGGGVTGPPRERNYAYGTRVARNRRRLSQRQYVHHGLHLRCSGCLAMTLRRNILANYAGQGVVAALGLAFVPVYIHYLTIEAYGLVGLFAMMQVWMSMLDLGMTPTLSREMARFTAGATSIQSIRDLLRSLEIVFFAIAVAIAIIMLSASGFFAVNWLNANHLSNSTIKNVLVIMAFLLALRFCEGIYRSALIGLQKQVWFNTASVALAALRSVGAVAILAFVSATVEAFFVWQCAISVLTLSLLAAKVHFELPQAPHAARFSIAELAKVGKFAGGMFGIALIAVLLTQVDKLLLSFLLPLDQLGYYILASTVAGAMGLAVAPVIQAIYPVFVKLLIAGDERRLADSYHAAAQTISVVLAPAVALLVVYPKAILFVWSKNTVLALHTAPLLSLLAIGTSLNSLMHIPHQLQLASGWTRLALVTNIMALAVLVPALFWAVPRYGEIAAAIIWALLNLGYIVLQLPLMHRRLLTDSLKRWYLADVGAPFLAAGTVVAAASLAFPDAIGDRLKWSAILFVVGFLAATASILATSSIRQRLLDVVKTVCRRRARAG